jgi:hypothetical protein
VPVLTLAAGCGAEHRAEGSGSSADGDGTAARAAKPELVEVTDDLDGPTNV